MVGAPVFLACLAWGRASLLWDSGWEEGNPKILATLISWEVEG